MFWGQFPSGESPGRIFQETDAKGAFCFPADDPVSRGQWEPEQAWTLLPGEPCLICPFLLSLMGSVATWRRGLTCQTCVSHDRHRLPQPLLPSFPWLSLSQAFRRWTGSLWEDCSGFDQGNGHFSPLWDLAPHLSRLSGSEEECPSAERLGVGGWRWGGSRKTSSPLPAGPVLCPQQFRGL